jgi:hypothetical protein
MDQRGAAGRAAGVGRGHGVEVGAGLDQHPDDIGVADACRGDQRCVLVTGPPVDWRSGVDQRFGYRSGAGQLGGQAEPVVVEPQHHDVPERLAALPVSPMLHLLGGQLGVLGQQPGQPGQVPAVEDVAALDFQLQPGPAGEPVLAGQRELGGRQHELVRDCVDPRDRSGVAALGGVQQVLGLVTSASCRTGPRGRLVRRCRECW